MQATYSATKFALHVRKIQFFVFATYFVHCILKDEVHRPECPIRHKILFLNS